jgi:hypothetical protein
MSKNNTRSYHVITVIPHNDSFSLELLRRTSFSFLVSYEPSISELVSIAKRVPKKIGELFGLSLTGLADCFGIKSLKME